VTGARRSATYQSTGSLIMSTSDEPWPKQLISVLGGCPSIRKSNRFWKAGGTSRRWTGMRLRLAHLAEAGQRKEEQRQPSSCLCIANCMALGSQTPWRQL